MSKILLICSCCLLFLAVSCSDDSSAGPEEISKYMALKKAKYTKCEITFGEDTYTYDVAKKDSFRFNGIKLALIHYNSSSELINDYWFTEMSEVLASIYFDFVAGQISLMDYHYRVKHDKHLNTNSYNEGHYIDSTYNTKLSKIPFEISADSVITAELNEDELVSKLLAFKLTIQDIILKKDSSSTKDTVITELPAQKRIFKIKVW